jgi:hypothetical protein
LTGAAPHRQSLRGFQGLSRKGPNDDREIRLVDERPVPGSRPMVEISLHAGAVAPGARLNFSGRKPAFLKEIGYSVFSPSAAIDRHPVYADKEWRRNDEMAARF